MEKSSLASSKRHNLLLRISYRGKTGTMPATDAAIGMMDGAYFTSRSELLDFFNTTLNMNLTKIEQTATGAVACQLADIMFPKSVPMSRVSWEAKTPPEYVSNYKLLQAAFSKNKVQRYVDVDKLIRAKYQDNLEFCQWLKAFYDQVASPLREGYDPVAVRQRGKGGKKMPPQFQPRGGAVVRAAAAKKARSAGAAAAAARTTTGRTATTRTATRAARPTSAAGITSPPARKAGAQKENARTGPANRAAANKGSKDNAEKIVADATLLKKNKELTARNAELETTMLQMENERDFYFEKLRGIEVMLQAYEDQSEEERGVTGGSNGVISKIFKVLYAGAEDGIVVNDEGDLIGADGEIIGADDGGDDKGLTAGETDEGLNAYNDEEFEDDEALNAELEASLLED